MNNKSYTFFELSEQANIQLSIKMLSPDHCLHHLIPLIRPPPSYAIHPMQCASIQHAPNKIR